MKDFKKHIVIVAGGTGTRMNSELPKQFVLLKNKPIIIHVLERFLEYDKNIHLIISIHPEYKEALETLLISHHFSNSVTIVLGGDTRFQSVKNGLYAIKEKQGVVGIHDAARPLVSLQTIRNCFETAFEKGNAIPVIDISESIRQVSTETSQAVNRANYRIVQTPQCFELSTILNAFEQPYDSSFTDDATVLESRGGTIHLVEGNRENIKITTPYDLVVANALLH